MCFCSWNRNTEPGKAVEFLFDGYLIKALENWEKERQNPTNSFAAASLLAKKKPLAVEKKKREIGTDRDSTGC